MAKKNQKKDAKNLAPRILNRKARYDYHIESTIECGVMLCGSEVKSIRQGRVDLSEGFARIEPATGELWLYNMDVALYDHAASDRQHAPRARRKLLVHKRELQRLSLQADERGVTLIPLSLYFSDRGIAKIELAVARGKGKADKRETLKKQDAAKDIRRAMSRKRL